MSDSQVAEQIASSGGPAETSPAVNTEVKPSPAEQIATSEGGPSVAPAVADRAAPSSEPNKMENRLEEAKESKTPAKKDTDVAGRKEKGALGLGFFKKLFGKKEKKSEATAAS